MKLCLILSSLLFGTIASAASPRSAEDTRNYTYKCSLPSRQLTVNAFFEKGNPNHQLEMIDHGNAVQQEARDYQHVEPGTELTIRSRDFELATLDQPIVPNNGHPLVHARFRYLMRSVSLMCAFYGW